MIVYNGAGKDIAVRPFAAGVVVGLVSSIKIPAGQSSAIFGPVLPEYGLSGFYRLDGQVLVRDWGPPQIVVGVDVPMLRLWPRSKELYKVPFALNQSLYEGFLVSFWEDRELIKFWI